ncbi:DUF2127 domain-containing protein [Patescibacteria group bacterium]|nr:DUF2127 domain-containing protein [Patescibacteria group bacterium]
MTPQTTLSPNTQDHLHKAFLATILMNGVIAVLDILAGFFFAFTGIIDPFLTSLSSGTGILATLASLVQTMSDKVQTIGAFYFFSHGAVKLLLVWGLWKNRLWAYPVSIIFLSGFSIYQLYEISVHFSLIVTAFLLFNTIVIILVINEYRRIVAMTKLTINKTI